MEWHQEIQQKLDEVISRLDKLLARLQPKLCMNADEPVQIVAADV